jgi:hypothetical protein
LVGFLLLGTRTLRVLNGQSDPEQPSFALAPAGSLPMVIARNAVTPWWVCTRQ